MSHRHFLLAAVIAGGGLLGCTSGPVGGVGVEIAPGARSEPWSNRGAHRNAGGGCGSGVENRTAQGREAHTPGLRVDLQIPTHGQAPSGNTPGPSGVANDPLSAREGEFASAIGDFDVARGDSHVRGGQARQLMQMEEGLGESVVAPEEVGGREAGSEPSPEREPDRTLVSTTSTLKDGSVVTIEGGYRDGLEYMQLTCTRNGRKTVSELWWDPNHKRDRWRLSIYENGRLVDRVEINEDGSTQGEHFDEDGKRTRSWWDPPPASGK